jgi:hypothetical protein
VTGVITGKAQSGEYCPFLLSLKDRALAIQISGDQLLTAMKNQRGAIADEAAVLAAGCMARDERIKELEADVAVKDAEIQGLRIQLEPPKPAAADPEAEAEEALKAGFEEDTTK